MSARTKKVESDYANAKRLGTLVPLHQVESLKDWKYWKLIPNRFPHDRLVTKHDLVVLRRESPVFEITPMELEELWYEILPWADTLYDFTKLNLKPMRSVEGIPHVHLCIYKETYR